MPAQPPLPRCMYLPFHTLAGGSHNRKLISESDVGRATPATSQWRGTMTSGNLDGAPTGCFSGPAPTDAADVNEVDFLEVFACLLCTQQTRSNGNPCERDVGN